MITTIVLFVWMVFGGFLCGLVGIPYPNSTDYGKDHPIEAFIAMLLMALYWPLTLIKRRNFARRGETRTWLSQP